MPFLGTIWVPWLYGHSLLTSTSNQIILRYVIKLKSSLTWQKDTKLANHQINLIEILKVMKKHGRFRWWMCSRQIYRNCVMLYHINILKEEVCSILLSLYHEELSYFWSQKQVKHSGVVGNKCVCYSVYTRVLSNMSMWYP